MRVIIAAGGTGGHIYPAVTIARELLRRDPKTKILFVGGKKGLESDIVPKEGFNLVTLELAGIPRKLSPQIITSVWLAGRGIFKTFSIIRSFRPDLVIGTGGYVCGPMLFAASLLGVPTAIQEQNAFPGLTNRMLGKFVKRIFLAYPEAGRFFNKNKISVTGNPIRYEEFANISRQAAESSLGLLPNKINLLVFGGSQSAQKINNMVLKLLKQLLTNYPNLQLLMMTGPKQFESIKAQVDALGLTSELSQRIHLFSYFYKIAEAYSATDLVIARAGAISLAEITCFGIPGLLVPFPYATNNHQEFNARYLEKMGAAKVILESELSVERLWKELSPLIEDEKLRRAMGTASKNVGKPKAVQNLVDQLLKLS